MSMLNSLKVVRKVLDKNIDKERIEMSMLNSLKVIRKALDKNIDK